MLTIDRLSIQLPPGFEPRAAGLVDLIGARLASLVWSDDASINHMRVDHPLSSAHASDDAIANDVAAAVARRVRGGA